MSVVRTVDDVYYPESDGQPMGETDVHIDWTYRLRDMLKYRYRNQRIYVAGNLLVYFERGQPTKYVVPDGFVVKDCDPGVRRVFKIWEEGKSPNVVFEFTSLSSRRDDQVKKMALYARLGVKEYFLYDPTADYLNPQLQGFRLAGSAYVPIEPDQSGRLVSEELGIHLHLRDGVLVLSDVRTGEEVLTESEAKDAELKREEAARRAAEEETKKERAARESAEAARKIAEEGHRKERAAREFAEAELARLRNRPPENGGKDPK